jgi:deazaflavin-dependent oxidoreductase (nitroreductase family)
MSRARRIDVVTLNPMGTGRYASDVGADPAHLPSIRARYKRLLERLGHTWWFAVGMRRVGARVDAHLYRLSRGRVSIAGPALFPVLLLTTVGRRSGRPRTTPLVYVRDGEKLIISSESFGQNKPAAWTLNLAAEPFAFVQVRRYRGAYVAEPAAPADVERYWALLLEAWPAHETYRRRSGVRNVYVLRPVPAP